LLFGPRPGRIEDDRVISFDLQRAERAPEKVARGDRDVAQTFDARGFCQGRKRGFLKIERIDGRELRHPKGKCPDAGKKIGDPSCPRDMRANPCREGFLPGLGRLQKDSRRRRHHRLAHGEHRRPPRDHDLAMV
jgi:hypothetical protein